jgi:hypothetical protein
MIAFILCSNGPPGLIHPLLAEKYAWVDELLEFRHGNSFQGPEFQVYEYQVNDCQDDDKYKGDDEYQVNDCQDDDEYKGDDEYKEDDEYSYTENIKYNTPCSVSYLYEEEEKYNISVNSVDSDYSDAGYASEQYSEVSALSNDDIGEYESDEWYMYSTMMY